MINGQKKSKHSVSVESMQMLDTKESNQSTSAKQPLQASQENTPAPLNDKDNPFSDEIENENIPF